MLLQIFGLVARPTWWHLNRIPPGGGPALAESLHETIPGAKHLCFFIGHVPLVEVTASYLSDLWSRGVGQLIAKPTNTTLYCTHEARLLLVTTQGPDAGRVFPLTRATLSVGRGGARAQVRDPWLSAHEFDIRLSASGTVITPVRGKSVNWKTEDAFLAGTTLFTLQRGAGETLQAPQPPGAFEVSPGQPPSPPNIVLQVIGAAAPLMIGIVLMMVTGMWYFLLFSGISVIIAFVLIAQYRRARSRFINKIQKSLTVTTERFRDSIFTPHQLMLAVSAPSADPLALGTTQPDNPVIHLGTGIRQATIPHVQETRRWDPYLKARVDLAILLEPGHQTVIVGASDLQRPLRNWIIAQLLRHAKATNTGFMFEGVPYGGPAIVEISEHLSPAKQPVHQLVFSDDADVIPDSSTVVVDLTRRRLEGAIVATEVDPIGISSSTLNSIVDELGLNKPSDQLHSDHLAVSAQCMQSQATGELMTTVATGVLGLEVDLVADGPHMLITGTTGSGKSELLLTVLAGFVERYPPSEVSLILLDFKGGSSFNVLAPLPHTMNVETNHVAATSFRSLTAIAAELFRREALFAEYKVADYAAFRSKAPHIILPRLVVAIDELRVLVEQKPDASTTLAHLASTGRSLGFHLIIATQRTQGAVSADIRANIGSTICLRTATEHDSWDVLGTADAFSISQKTPGRAFFKTGAGRPRLFQTSRYMLDHEPIVIHPCDSSQPPEVRTTTDWLALTQRLIEYAAPLLVPSPVMLPALPNQVCHSSLPRLANNTEMRAIGLVDDPAQARQYPVYLGPSSDTFGLFVLSTSVAWIGAAGSGLAETLNIVIRCVVESDAYRVFLDGRQVGDSKDGWQIYLHHAESDGDVLRGFITDLSAALSRNSRVTIVIADWGSWVNALISGSFQGFEEQLIHLLRQYPTNLKVYVFGGRELAGGRLVGMIPDRFYLPKNSSAEHRMIWPKLLEVPSFISRAVLVTAERPNGGWEVQLVDDT